jgi:hypothetical protein
MTTQRLHAVTRISRAATVWIACGAVVAGCAVSPREAVFDGGSAVETRSYQTRTLMTADSNAALRAVIATLQDLGFVIDRADAALGTVSATKLDRYQVRMTVSARPGISGQVLVRASADYAEPAVGRTAVPIDDPLAYQDFFQALERSAFLAAQRTE